MSKARILLVEDEAIIAMEIEDTLRTLGYEVTSIANSGDKAIQRAEAERPDLILMDIRIRGDRDGIETAEIIRSRFDIPVVFSTAYLDEERIERAKITMPFGYLLKPIQERDLKVTLEMALYVAKVDAERRNAERKIQDSEVKYRTLFETSPIGIQISDLDGVIIFSNRAHQEIHGLSEQDILGEYLWSFNADDAEKEREKREYFEFLRTGQPTLFYGIDISGRGKRYHFQINRGQLRKNDGRVYAVCSFLTDLTEIRKAEETTRNINDRLELATRSAGIGIWDFDIQKNELIWDDRMFELYGVSKKEFSGTYEAWIAGLHPEDRERADNEVKTARNGDGLFDTEFRVVRPDGTIRRIKASAKVVKSEDGTPIRMIGVNYDITETKKG